MSSRTLHAHVEPFAGASGDMLLGALIDAGAQVERIVAVLDGLDLPGWSIDVRPVERGGIGATKVEVHAEADGVVRTWGNVRELLEGAELPERVRRRALSAFGRLAAAEARIHRRDVDRVHFHEVGAVDALVDVVGVCAGFELLGVERVTCGPVAQGTGMTRAAHGLLPVPAPAVLALLEGVPITATGEPAELCTPTGAALLVEWVDAFEEPPPLRLRGTGYGAGSRQLDRPNVLRVLLGEPLDAHEVLAGGHGSSTAALVSCTVDDLPGELVPVVLDALRAAGADDAWARPVVMKKGRPGVELVALAPADRVAALQRVLFAESTTLGLRTIPVGKVALDRRSVTVEVAGQPVRLKLGLLDGEVVNVAPEFDDCAAAAAATGLPVKEVYARARAAFTGEGAG